MEQTYEEYAIITAQINTLEEQKEVLKEKILKSMNKQGAETIKLSLGKFTIAKVKKWVYPQKVVDLGEKFKVAKAKSESTGEATYTESDSLRFTSVKI